jgi:hypothetical protein
MYSIRLLEAATRQLARLDKPVGRRIVERARWLAAHLDTINPEATGFKGLLHALLQPRRRRSGKHAERADGDNGSRS